MDSPDQGPGGPKDKLLPPGILSPEGQGLWRALAASSPRLAEGSRAKGGDSPPDAHPSGPRPGAPEVTPAGLADERSPRPFRDLLGSFLRRSHAMDTALLRARLAPVDLTPDELRGVRRIRLLVAELNAGTLEDEAYALSLDPARHRNLDQILGLLTERKLEIRSAPLGGWSPDFSVFWKEETPFALLLGLHWFQRPFPHRGPAWVCWFGPAEARQGAYRFEEIWRNAHEIGPAVERILRQAVCRRGGRETENEPKGGGESPPSTGPDPKTPLGLTDPPAPRGWGARIDRPEGPG